VLRVKKITLSILSIVLLIGLNACSNRYESNKSAANSDEQGDKVVKEKDVREMVWMQLSLEQKEWIDGT